MSEVMIEQDVRSTGKNRLKSNRVLDVLSMVSGGNLESTGRIEGIYCDAIDLMKRAANINADICRELRVLPSPYLVHLEKMNSIENRL